MDVRDAVWDSVTVGATGPMWMTCDAGIFKWVDGTWVKVTECMHGVSFDEPCEQCRTEP